MWVRWRLYTTRKTPLRWHRVWREEPNRTLCGRRFGKLDFLETDDDPPAHDRCTNCARQP